MFFTCCLFQASYPPYIFECLLAAPVDDVAGTAQVGNGAVLFRLNKKEPGLWGKLQSADAGGYAAMSDAVFFLFSFWCLCVILNCFVIFEVSVCVFNILLRICFPLIFCMFLFFAQHIACIFLLSCCARHFC